MSSDGNLVATRGLQCYTRVTTIPNVSHATCGRL